MRGRKRKPTALKLIEGEPNKRRINLNEPKPRPVAPSCPKHLAPAAKKEWKRISKDLERIGLLTTIDMAALAGYCQAWARWLDAEVLLKEVGPVLKSNNGMYYQNPVLAVANKAMEQMLKFLTEFGMTPSSRTRIKVNPDRDNDGDDLLS